MDMNKVIMPKDIHDARRWNHNRLRRRLLEGDWEDDLRNYIANFIDPRRQESWGVPSQAVNIFKSVVQQISVLYDQTPVVRNPHFNDISENYFKGLNIFSKHQKHEQNVKALRESLIRIEYMPKNKLSEGGINLRLVTPDYVVIGCMPEAPGVPCSIMEARNRRDPISKKEHWYWDIWDISDPNNPYFKIITNEDKPVDVTKIFAPDMVEYPYKDSNGNPFLPWVLYHARNTGCCWDTHEWSELVYATLDIGLLHTFWKHIVREASWQQKYGLDVDLSGMDKVGQIEDTSRDRIAVDPASILLFSSQNEKNGSLGSFSISGDPEKIINAIQQYQRIISETIGLGDIDSQKTSPQSGIALMIRRDSIRDLQKKFTPEFRKADTELLEKVAKINNLFEETQLPTTGYQIEYISLPLSHDERTANLDRITRLVELGVASKVDIYLEMHPGVTRQEAIIRLQEIRTENLNLS